MMNRKIRIVIADDHQLVIDGLQMMLATAEDMECVASAANGKIALECLALHQTDVLLLDINMPEMDGVECCRIVQTQYPHVKVLVLSMMRDVSLIKIMLKQGASGFLLKNAGKEEVLEAIRMVHDGKQAFSTEVLDSIMNSLSTKPTTATAPPFLKISRREKQILQLIVEERTTSEIASELFISFGTVETHRRNLLMKLNARNTAGLVKAALVFDLLS